MAWDVTCTSNKVISSSILRLLILRKFWTFEFLTTYLLRTCYREPWRFRHVWLNRTSSYRWPHCLLHSPWSLRMTQQATREWNPGGLENKTKQNKNTEWCLLTKDVSTPVLQIITFLGLPRIRHWINVRRVASKYITFTNLTYRCLLSTFFNSLVFEEM